MTIETATLAGGCFWCTEAVFNDVIGVTGVESGYIGGSVPNPTYRQVCGGDTGHAEAIRVTFDSDQIGRFHDREELSGRDGLAGLERPQQRLDCLDPHLARLVTTEDRLERRAQRIGSIARGKASVGIANETGGGPIKLHPDSLLACRTSLRRGIMTARH